MSLSEFSDRAYELAGDLLSHEWPGEDNDTQQANRARGFDYCRRTVQQFPDVVLNQTIYARVTLANQEGLSGQLDCYRWLSTRTEAQKRESIRQWAVDSNGRLINDNQQAVMASLNASIRMELNALEENMLDRASVADLQRIIDELPNAPVSRRAAKQLQSKGAKAVPATAHASTQAADLEAPYRQLYRQYKETILKAAKAGDADEVAKLTVRFNERLGGRLLSVRRVQRLKPGQPEQWEMLLDRDLAGARQKLAKINYPGIGDGTPHVSHEDGFVRILPDKLGGGRYEDDVYIDLAVAGDFARPLGSTQTTIAPAATQAAAGPAAQPGARLNPRTMAGVLAIRPAPRIEGLARRSRPEVSGEEAGEAFWDILKLRDLADPRAVPELVQILASNAGTGRIHGYAASQALFCIGNSEAKAALEHLKRLDEYTEELGSMYAFHWDMPEPRRSQYIRQYWLQPVGNQLAISLDAKPQRDGKIEFTLTVKNVSNEVLDVQDPPIGRLYLRDKDGQFVLNRPMGTKDDYLYARWTRLNPGQAQTRTEVGQLAPADAIRKSFPQTPDDAVAVLSSMGQHYSITRYGPHEAVFVLERAPLAAETAAKLKLGNAWTGRAVAPPVALVIAAPAAMAPDEAKTTPPPPGAK